MKSTFTMTANHTGSRFKRYFSTFVVICFGMVLLPTNSWGGKINPKKSPVKAKPLIDFTVAAGSNTPVTTGTAINLTATPSPSTPPGGGVYTYKWTGPNGFTSTTQNPSKTVSVAADAGTYTVKAVGKGTTKDNFINFGDFENAAGTDVEVPTPKSGFLSSTYTSSASTGNATYNITTAASTGGSGYETSPSCGDHSTVGAGGRLLGSGPGTAQGSYVLAMGFYDMALTQGFTYTFSFWATSVAGTPNPVFEVWLNDTQQGADFTVSATRCTWTQYTTTFVAPAGLSKIEIYDVMTSGFGAGNNFAIDDIELYTYDCEVTATTTVAVNTVSYGTAISNANSTCSFATGQSIRTFTGNVAFTTNLASDFIDVYHGANLIASYPVSGASGTVAVSAPYPANGSNQISTRLRSTANAPTATTVSTVGCAPSCPGANVVGGKVYREANNNGTATLPEAGIGGVTVKIYDEANALVGTTVSAPDGSYIFDVTAATGTMFRVEFDYANFSPYHSAIQGSTNGSSVRFVAKGTCNADFTIQNPADYCQATPPIVTTCFVSGDPLQAGGAGTPESIVYYPYSAANSTPYPTKLASTGNTGSVWGLAYHQADRKLFSAALMKRHSGLGINRLGGLYITNTITNVTTPYADLSTLGIDVGQALVNAAPRTTLTGNPTVSSIDKDAFDWTGKIGLGDMSYSADGYLWTVNLYQKKLIRINVGADVVKTSLTAGDVTEYPITPLPTATNGETRPFAVKYKDGKVYVGLVTTNENAAPGVPSAPNANLNAYVMEFDAATSTFSATPVLTMPLTYKKGKVHTGETYGEYWASWVNTFPGLTVGAKIGNGSYRSYRPQALLSDIDFTDDGDMIIAFTDRTGHQTGTRNRSTVAADTKLYNGYIGGDMLRARKVGATYTLESNGKVLTTNGSGIGNAQGPGGGEFYNGDFYTTIHLETIQGGIVVAPGTGQVVANLMDPVTVFSGGTGWNNNSNGARVKVYQLYDSNADAARTFGKAVGLGDLEALCNPTPIEIGNRIWKDTNGDGIQNANEVGMAGVKVTLYGTGLPAAGISVVTNAQGVYSFSSATATNTANSYNGLPLKAGNAYEIIVAQKIPQGTIDVCEITTKDAGAGTNQNFVDSDVDPATGKISFTLGSQTNHSFDIGYKTAPCVSPTFSAAVVTPTCTGQTVQNNGTITLNILTNATSYGVTAGTTFSGTFPGTATSGASATVQSGIPNIGGNYTVRVYNTTASCFKDTTIYIAPAPCVCIKPTFSLSSTPPDCNSSTAVNNGKIMIQSSSNADKFGFSSGSTYAGPAYAAATAILFAPTTVTSSIPNTGGTFTVRIFNGSLANCFKDTTITIPPNPCSCVKPSFNYTVTAQTCTGTTPNNNGKITITGLSDADRYAVVADATFSGLNYSQATAITSGAFDAKTGIDNSGGDFTIRFYNGNNSCFKDTTINVPTVFCGTPCLKPQFTFSVSNPTCNSGADNNDGTVTMLTLLNGNRAAVAPGSTFPASPSQYDYDSVTFDAGVLPSIVRADIPNTGGSFTMRVWNRSATCFKDTTFTILPNPCCPTIAALNVPPTGCTNSNIDISASGLLGFGTKTVKFLLSPTDVTTAAQAYALTNSLGEANVVGTAASLNGALLPGTAGTVYIVAIVSPAPADAGCRPFLKTPITLSACPTPCPLPNCGTANIKR